MLEEKRGFQSRGGEERGEKVKISAIITVCDKKSKTQKKKLSLSVMLFNPW